MPSLPGALSVKKNLPSHDRFYSSDNFGIFKLYLSHSWHSCKNSDRKAFVQIEVYKGSVVTDSLIVNFRLCRENTLCSSRHVRTSGPAHE